MTDNTLCLIKTIKMHLKGSSVQRTFYQSKKKIYDYEVYAYKHPEVHDGELIFFEVYENGRTCVICHDTLIDVDSTDVFEEFFEELCLKMKKTKK